MAILLGLGKEEAGNGMGSSVEEADVRIGILTHGKRQDWNPDPRQASGLES